MIALMPYARRNSLLPRVDSPFARIPEFGTLIDRFLNSFLDTDVPETPNYAVTTEENDKEFLVRFELPGFEPAEVKVELTGDRLTVEAEHREPAAKPEEGPDRVRTRVRRMITLPPEIDLEKVQATYRNGMLEVHIPREPEAAGRRIEVKT